MAAARAEQVEPRAGRVEHGHLVERLPHRPPRPAAVARAVQRAVVQQGKERLVGDVVRRRPQGADDAGWERGLGRRPRTPAVDRAPDGGRIGRGGKEQ